MDANQTLAGLRQGDAARRSGQQSHAKPRLQEADVDRRKQLIWQIERKLAEDVANPIIYHGISNTCWWGWALWRCPAGETGLMALSAWA